YHRQADLFKTLIDKSSVGAFIIYGEEDYGQGWLLNRLIYRVPRTTTGLIFPINLKPRGGRWGLDALHSEFKRRYPSLANTLSLQDIVDRVHEWWHTQTVILIFHNVDALDTEQMKEFFHGF